MCVNGNRVLLGLFHTFVDGDPKAKRPREQGRIQLVVVLGLYRGLDVLQGHQKVDLGHVTLDFGLAEQFVVGISDIAVTEAAVVGNLDLIELEQLRRNRKMHMNSEDFTPITYNHFFMVIFTIHTL